MTTITWKAEQLERNTSDGLVTTVFWRANAVDENYTATAYGSVGLQRGESFVDYATLTESQVIDWAKDKLEVTEIEANLEAQIEIQKNPIKATGVPW